MSLKDRICDRCKTESNTFTMSMFNKEEVCMECYHKEKQHPQYKEACRVEREHLLKGDYNYPGIGKPKDL